jgi:hypothetical protein
MPSRLGWIIRRLRDCVDGFIHIDGVGDQLLAVLGLLMSKSLFSGFRPVRGLDQIHACLFGIHERSALFSF